jgi:inositol-phosphate transport system ATP-binding protein
MRTEIKSLQEKLGITTILVTHDQIEATTMADRIICMREGRIEQIGSPNELYHRPSSLFVAGFIGSPPINLIASEIREGALRVGDAALPLTGAAGNVSLGLRPEHLAFGETGLAGRIAQTEPMGREVLYVVDTGIGYVRLLEQGSDIAHAIGAPVHVSFEPANSLVFDTATGRLIEGAEARPA